MAGELMRHTRQLQLTILRKWRQNERRMGVGGSKFRLCNTKTNSKLIRREGQVILGLRPNVLGLKCLCKSPR